MNFLKVVVAISIMSGVFYLLVFYETDDMKYRKNRVVKKECYKYSFCKCYYTLGSGVEFSDSCNKYDIGKMIKN